MKRLSLLLLTFCACVTLCLAEFSAGLGKGKTSTKLPYCRTTEPVVCEKGFEAYYYNVGSSCRMQACKRKGHKCPPVTLSTCKEGKFLRKVMDKDGCLTARCSICTKETENLRGCRSSSKDKKKDKDSKETTGDKEKVKMTLGHRHRQCPPLSRPTCPPDHFLQESVDWHGCPYLECLKCDAYSRYVKECRRTCEPEKVCPSGYYLHLRYRRRHRCFEQRCNRCTKRTRQKPGCKKNKCDDLYYPYCKQGTYVMETENAYGCPVYTCEDCTSETYREPKCKRDCPNLRIPKCSWRSYLLETRDKRNCPRLRCVKCGSGTSDKPGCGY